MQFAVVKIAFENDSDTLGPDRKEVAAFLERLRSRFRVVALALHHADQDGMTSIAYTTLAQNEEAMTKQLDAIASFCEEQGFGRIADEAVLMDDIETIDQQESP